MTREQLISALLYRGLSESCLKFARTEWLQSTLDGCVKHGLWYGKLTFKNNKK
jgi:hypothetical protein